jgi:hypothetical protein
MLNNVFYDDHIFTEGITKTFGQVFKSNSDFLDELLGRNIKKFPQGEAYKTMLEYYELNDPDYLQVVYLLLYSRYGNWNIASTDESRFKANLVERICSYGPTHKKRLELQKELRKLTTEQVQEGSIDITNMARNPSTRLKEKELIDQINAQNQAFHKRSKTDAIIYQYNILDKDLNGEFIEIFKPLFAKFIGKPILYANYQEDEE